VKAELLLMQLLFMHPLAAYTGSSNGTMRVGLGADNVNTLCRRCHERYCLTHSDQLAAKAAAQMTPSHAEDASKTISPV
jgi:hypothetical protein